MAGDHQEPMEIDRPAKPELFTRAAPVEHLFFVRASIGYLALALAFFWPAFWFGLVPLPLLNPYAQPDPIWASMAQPPRLAAGTNLLLGDVTGFYYPYVHYAIATLRAGEFPFWSPGVFGGIPLFAANQAALLYPINLVTYWFGPAYYWAAAALLRLLIAGIGTYLLVRRLGAGALGAFLSGGVYMFAAFNVVWLHFAVHNVSALLPLALWVTLRLIDARRVRDCLALAAIVAAQLFGGHPETSVAFMLIWVTFAATWLGRRPAWLRTAGWLALAGGLGIGLAAVQWLPTLVLIRDSYTLAQRAFNAHHGGQSAVDASPVGGLPIAEWGNIRYWLLLISPDLWGSPRGPQIHNWLRVPSNYNELASYVGLVTLPLAFAGAFASRGRRIGAYFGLMFVLSLALLYPLPGIYRLGYLPVLKVAAGIRFGLGITLGAAVLAGFGVEWLWRAGPRAQLCGALALGLLALLSLATIADLWGGQAIRWTLGYVPDAGTRAAIAEVYQASNWRLFLPAAAGLAAALGLAAATRGWLAPRRVGALVAGLAIAEVLIGGFGYNGFTRPANLYPTTPVTAWLHHDPEAFRVLNLDDTLWANSALTQGLEVTGGMDDLVSLRHQRFIQRGTDAFVRVEDRRVAMDWARRLLDVMNVRYVLTTRTLTQGPDGPAYPLAFADKGVRVYRNPSALPRAYAARAIVLASARDAEDAVYDRHFDPSRAVVLEEPRSPLPPAPATPVTSVPIVGASANRVELAPNLAQQAVVVLAEAFDPDWQVTIDGQPARLLRANAMFRGVVVPAGQHRVVFRYWPRYVVLGALASAGALAACVGLGLWPWLRRRQLSNVS